MKTLKNKLGKKGGFTLVEMLIVVAIIAILIAVSIPLVSSSLEKARRATDAANERAAKAEALILYLDDDADVLGATTEDTALTYHAAEGSFDGSDSGYGQCAKHKGGTLKVWVTSEGEVDMVWDGVSGEGSSKEPHDGKTDS